MIEKILAELILENPEEMRFFVDLISKSIVYNTGELIVPNNIKNKQTLEMYQISGLLTFSQNFDKLTVQLKDGDDWILSGPKIKTKDKKEKKNYCPNHLQELGVLLTLPADWHTNIGKYVRNYLALLRTYSKEQIDEVCDFVIANNPKIDLNMFLTRHVFADLRNSMITKHNKGKSKREDRVDVADYSEDQPF